MGDLYVVGGAGGWYSVVHSVFALFLGCFLCLVVSFDAQLRRLQFSVGSPSPRLSGHPHILLQLITTCIYYIITQDFSIITEWSYVSFTSHQYPTSSLSLIVRL